MLFKTAGALEWRRSIMKYQTGGTFQVLNPVFWE